jgi:hypothetical protein
VTGTLTDGTAFNTRFFDADGGNSVDGNEAATSNLFFNNAAVTVAAEPEAGTLSLFALAGVGALGLVVRHKC